MASHHDTPLYRASRAVIVPAAYLNPNHLCPTCGRTLQQIRRSNPRAGWQCGHKIPGLDRPGNFWAQCSPCNQAGGAAMTNNQRTSSYDW